MITQATTCTVNVSIRPKPVLQTYILPLKSRNHLLIDIENVEHFTQLHQRSRMVVRLTKSYSSLNFF